MSWNGPDGPVGPPGGEPPAAIIDGRAKWLDPSGRWCELCGTKERSAFYRCSAHLHGTLIDELHAHTRAWRAVFDEFRASLGGRR